MNIHNGSALQRSDAPLAAVDPAVNSFAMYCDLQQQATAAALRAYHDLFHFEERLTLEDEGDREALLTTRDPVDRQRLLVRVTVRSTELEIVRRQLRELSAQHRSAIDHAVHSGLWDREEVTR